MIEPIQRRDIVGMCLVAAVVGWAVIEGIIWLVTHIDITITW